MSISATQVKELREKTGAGMMDCKVALTEANGDFEKAIELLRKKGASVAAKRAERSANEGIIKTKILNDGKIGVIVEVNCETDFVAKSDDFQNFAEFVLNTLAAKRPSSINELMNSEFEGKKMADALNEITGKIGEKIEISRFKIDEVKDGLFVDYIHHGSKLGVLIKAEDSGAVDTNKVSELMKDFAMQTAAMKPMFVSRNQVPKELIESEKEIYKEVAKKEGKPEQILDKIAEGRLNKFYEEVCLLEQAFIKDNTKKVEKVLDEFNKANSSKVKLSEFYRFHLSDEKK